MTYKIAVLSGDGIGPEVMSEALRVLKATVNDNDFDMAEGLIGGAAFDAHNEHFPEKTKTLYQNADAILFGSVGGPIDQAHLPKWHKCEANSILALRKTFQLSANLRPAAIYKELSEISPLKASVIRDGVDILIIRELVGGIYFGEHKQFRKGNIRYATDVAEYNEEQITEVAKHAFEAARKRDGKLTSVDKANVLDTSKLWREVVSEVAEDYPDVTLEHMLVDNCAMQLFIKPGQFDVIVTSNLFGDILSDAAAALPGSLGLMPSASLNKDGFGLYEPSGGSAPQLAGQNVANPIAQVLSVAMMLRYSFNMTEAADKIEQAVQKTLQKNFATQDIYVEGKQLVGMREMTDAIISNL